MIEKAIALVFGYTIDHTSRSEDEATMQLLGIRLFNATASGLKRFHVLIGPRLLR
jgi:hypothetical protein